VPRCLQCESAHVIIVISLNPEAICLSCGARWVQAGSEQHTIERI
jgi:hypothetical protein